MNGYLLTFKHDKMPWSDLENKIEHFRSGESVQTWSSGARKNIPVGAPAYLMRQGPINPGIFGYGIVKEAPQEYPHYDAEKREQGKTNLQVAVNFQYFFDPREKIVISKDELLRIDSALWNAQGSGRKIPNEIELQISHLFQSRVGAELEYPDELPPDNTYIEGASKQVSVNAYERNAEARQKCIELNGTTCKVCDFNFEYSYGPVGKGYIHVHHRVPLSQVGQDYEVDPSSDLVPVCPNCHAMLHSESPPLDIKELRSRVLMYRR